MYVAFELFVAFESIYVLYGNQSLCEFLYVNVFSVLIYRPNRWCTWKRVNNSFIIHQSKLVPKKYVVYVGEWRWTVFQFLIPFWSISTFKLDHLYASLLMWRGLGVGWAFVRYLLRVNYILFGKTCHWCKVSLKHTPFPLKIFLDLHNTLDIGETKKKIVKGIICIVYRCIWKKRNKVSFSNTLVKVEEILEDIDLLGIFTWKIDDIWKSNGRIGLISMLISNI